MPGMVATSLYTVFGAALLLRLSSMAGNSMHVRAIGAALSLALGACNVNKLLQAR